MQRVYEMSLEIKQLVCKLLEGVHTIHTLYIMLVASLSKFYQRTHKAL